MATEIFEAIFGGCTWVPGSEKPLLRLENGESITGKKLMKKYGINIPTLGRITDGLESTFIKANKGKLIGIGEIISNPDNVADYEVISGHDVGVRQAGNVPDGYIGIQVRRL